MPTMNAQDLAARLDRLPPGRFHRRVLAALAFAFFFELGDLNTFAYVAPQLRDTMGLSVHQVALITSAGFLGCSSVRPAVAGLRTCWADDARCCCR